MRSFSVLNLQDCIAGRNPSSYFEVKLSFLADKHNASQWRSLFASLYGPFQPSSREGKRLFHLKTSESVPRAQANRESQRRVEDGLLQVLRIFLRETVLWRRSQLLEERAVACKTILGTRTTRRSSVSRARDFEVRHDRVHLLSDSQ